MNYNYSFSGSDCHTFISFMEPNYLRGWVQLDSVNTLSISVHEQRSQVRRLGHAGAVGFAGSIRTVAGSIIMTIINENPFNDLIKGAGLQKNFSTRVSKTEAGAINDLRLPYSYTSPGKNYEFRRTNNPASSRYSIPNITTLPPTKIRMRFVSEYHSNNPKRAFESVNKKEAANEDREVERIMELHNVVFISENVVTSVNNMVTELVLQFIASDFIEFTKQKDEKERIAAIKLESEQEQATDEENQTAVAGESEETNNNTSNAVSNSSSNATSETGAVSTSPVVKETNNAVGAVSTQAAPTETAPATTKEEVVQKEVQPSDPESLTDGEKQYNNIISSRRGSEYFKEEIGKIAKSDLKKIGQYINPKSDKYIKEDIYDLAFYSDGTGKTAVIKDKYPNGKTDLEAVFDAFEKPENQNDILNIFTNGEFSFEKERENKQKAALDLLGDLMLIDSTVAYQLSETKENDGSSYLKDLRTDGGYAFLRHSYTRKIQESESLKEAFGKQTHDEIIASLMQNQNNYYGKEKTKYNNKYIDFTASLIEILNSQEGYNADREKIKEEYQFYINRMGVK